MVQISAITSSLRGSRPRVPVFDELLDQDSEISAFLGDIALCIMERAVFVSIFFFHLFVVKRVRLLILRVPLDFHQHLVNWRV
jgi:hypothetical protein